MKITVTEESHDLYTTGPQPIRQVIMTTVEIRHGDIAVRGQAHSQETMPSGVTGRDSWAAQRALATLNSLLADARVALRERGLIP